MSGRALPSVDERLQQIRNWAAREPILPGILGATDSVEVGRTVRFCTLVGDPRNAEIRIQILAAQRVYGRPAKWLGQLEGGEIVLIKAQPDTSEFHISLHTW